MWTVTQSNTSDSYGEACLKGTTLSYECVNAMVAYPLTLHAQQGLLRWTKSPSILLLLENHSDSLINVCVFKMLAPFPGEQDRQRAMWHAKPRQHNGDKNQNLLRPDCMRQDGPNIFLETLKTQRVMHNHLQTVAHMVSGLITFTHLL